MVKTIAKHRDRLGTTWNESNQDLANHLNNLRTNVDTVNQAKNFAGHQTHLPTLAIMQELLRPAFLDKTMSINKNDIGDIHHAILSISYCDYALLDGKWEDMSARMVKRFSDLNLPIRTAKVFSARRLGVQRFLAQLEGATESAAKSTTKN